MHTVTDPQAGLAWLADRPRQEALTGYDAQGWEASTWVLHAMYENPNMPADATYQQARQARLRDGTEQPLIIGGMNLDEFTTVTGVPLGYGGSPGRPWRRLRWWQYAQRLNWPLGSDQSVPPCFRWFPIDSWPLNVRPPTEGSLDEVSLAALLNVLATTSRHGPDTACFAFYGSVPAADFDHPTLLAGPISTIGDLLVGEDAYQATPSNIWPADRSWFVWTDWDLWATKVSGPGTIIEAIGRHPDLETITWPARQT